MKLDTLAVAATTSHGLQAKPPADAATPDPRTFGGYLVTQLQDASDKVDTAIEVAGRGEDVVDAVRAAKLPLSDVVYRDGFWPGLRETWEQGAGSRQAGDAVDRLQHAVILGIRYEPDYGAITDDLTQAKVSISAALDAARDGVAHGKGNGPIPTPENRTAPYGYLPSFREGYHGV